jgi:hypothetical protein
MISELLGCFNYMDNGYGKVLIGIGVHALGDLSVHMTLLEGPAESQPGMFVVFNRQDAKW